MRGKAALVLAFAVFLPGCLGGGPRVSDESAAPAAPLELPPGVSRTADGSFEIKAEELTYKDQLLSFEFLVAKPGRAHVRLNGTMSFYSGGDDCAVAHISAASAVEQTAGTRQLGFVMWARDRDLTGVTVKANGAGQSVSPRAYSSPSDGSHVFDEEQEWNVTGGDTLRVLVGGHSVSYPSHRFTSAMTGGSVDNEMMVSVRVAGVERVVASTAGPLRCGVGFGSQDGATTVEAFGAKAAAGGKTELVTKTGSTVVWLDDPAQYNHNVAAVVRVAGETVPLRPRLTATTAKTGPTGIELERWAGLTVAHPKWFAVDAWLPGVVACDDPGPSMRPACAL